MSQRNLRVTQPSVLVLMKGPVKPRGNNLAEILRGFAGTVGGKSPAGLEGWGPSALPWDLADASGKVSHL